MRLPHAADSLRELADLVDSFPEDLQANIADGIAVPLMQAISILKAVKELLQAETIGDGGTQH